MNPCIKCGCDCVRHYKRKDGTERRECRKCTIENVLGARERRYATDRDAEREKATKQMRAWRLKNKKKEIETRRKRRFRGYI